MLELKLRLRLSPTACVHIFRGIFGGTVRFSATNMMKNQIYKNQYRIPPSPPDLPSTRLLFSTVAQARATGWIPASNPSARPEQASCSKQQGVRDQVQPSAAPCAGKAFARFL